MTKKQEQFQSTNIITGKVRTGFFTELADLDVRTWRLEKLPLPKKEPLCILNGRKIWGLQDLTAKKKGGKR